MAGWHHQLDGHEFEGTLGVDDGQGGLASCGSWGHKESDTTERLTEMKTLLPGSLEFSFILQLESCLKSILEAINTKMSKICI